MNARPNGSMPVEHLRITLKPNNFFKWSPALDVKAVEDAHSTLAFDTVKVGLAANSETTTESCGCSS